MPAFTDRTSNAEAQTWDNRRLPDAWANEFGVTHQRRRQRERMRVAVTLSDPA